MRVLVTGFGRFPGAPVNPTSTLAREMARRRRLISRGIHVESRILPTEWAILDAFDAHLAASRPDIVLMLGLAARRRHVSIELWAANAASRSPDAARRHAPGRALVTGGPGRRPCAALPAALLHALRLARLPAGLSRDAGRYLCNALAYRAYASVGARGRPARAVFVHIPPPVRAGIGLPALLRGLEDIVMALAAQLRAAPSR
ncbi:pyroglutamyl-peptidase I family protein [Ancylobacter terrae]|uniref:pyroglutamyl-peptidase I family protein n=1 Tax=Ancylobacter sp. sgz301288 TaxID=3342077 RepID=UPI00385DC1C5